MKRVPYKTVPMPEKKITYKKGKSGTVYVYHTIRAYRNAKGNPTSDEVAIGKKDLETGRLIPNARYFEYFTDTPELDSPREIKDYGNSYTLTEMAKGLGLLEILEDCFPKKWQEILTCASYMVCKGNVMMYMEDWCDTTYTPLQTGLDSRRISQLFASITYEERMKFFEKWIALRKEQEYIAYDVTSISTYAKEIDIAEWGYNRDGEALPQINLGMFFGEPSQLPVFYNIYSGSIADKSHLVFMMENTKTLGMEKVRFVMDRGFLTQGNIKYMDSHGFSFIIPFPALRTEVPKLLEQASKDLRTASNWIQSASLYGTCMDYELYGIKMKAHVFFSPDKCADEEKNLYAHLSKLEAELEKLNKPKRITKKYTDFFIVEKEKDARLNYQKNYQKMDECLKRAGYIVFLTTDLSCSPEELIQIYQGRDAIEKNFDNLKNDLDFRRLRTHMCKTTEGKVFVAFLALILRTCMQGKTKKQADTRKFTTEKILLELAKIKLVILKDGTQTLMPFTKTQKKILEALGISSEAVKNSTMDI